jgi:glycosyltransferase involved in cell wall biosynthesis
MVRNNDGVGNLAKVNSRVALLTGGGDKPYALGMAAALTQYGVELDFIGSDELATPELLSNLRVRFLNLRGAQGTDASIGHKIKRVILYYLRLLNYAFAAEPRIFHLLWNNKFELFDRTVLMLLYKVTGRKTVLTVHNVNMGKRDGNDSWLNRVSLKIQYRLADHLFVHTRKMKEELAADFSVSEKQVSVIPFGLNNTLPNTELSSLQARQILRIASTDKVLLFFGNIAPYKGLEHLVSALGHLAQGDKRYRLIIAGRPKQSEGYWRGIKKAIQQTGVEERIIARAEYIPDEEAEIYFKAADVLILPYTYVFQSGVLFLGYSFGLPAISTDVGSVREEIIEGKTGFVATSADPCSLADAIRRYFASELARNPEEHRKAIKAYANEQYSWSKVANVITGVYARLLEGFGEWEDGRTKDRQSLASDNL